METYVLDSTALIDLQFHFPGKIRKLKEWIGQDRMKIPEGVFRELLHKTDTLNNLIQKWKQTNPDFVIYFNQPNKLSMDLVRIEQLYGEWITVGKREYPGLWKSPSGKKAADGQVIAAAKIVGGVVVSDDRAIRLVCMLEGIPCIGWMELARLARFSDTQLTLL